MRSVLRARLTGVVLGVVVATTLHLLLGWAWTLAAGVLVGLLIRRGGWWAGGLVGAADWALLVGWSFWSAPAETARMVGTVGEILGGMSGVLFAGAVVGIGFLLGAVGGLAGSFLGAGARRAIRRT